MLRHIKRLLGNGKTPVSSPGAKSFARPVKQGVNKRNNKDRRQQQLPVAIERRKGGRRGADAPVEQLAVPAQQVVTEVADAVSSMVLKTGTDSRVVPIAMARRPEATMGVDSERGSVVVAQESGGVSSIQAVPSVQRQTPLTLAEKHEAQKRSVISHSIRRDVKTEADLIRALGRQWSGVLHGVVNADLANQCVPLHMTCGQTAVAITEMALVNAHWSVVRKRIREEWHYAILDVFVLPDAVVSSIYSKVMAFEDRNHTNQVHRDNSLLRVYDDIVNAAIEGKASDIHFETSGDVALVRLRVYGTLRPWLTLPANLVLGCLGAAFGLRFKTQSATKESFTDQNPVAFMTTQKINGTDWDGRVNGRPHAAGYKAVMRLLESSTRIADIPTLEGLGYNASHREMFNTALARQWGLIVAFGSTGEGKSTTLRSMLVHLPNAANMAIYSAESPVEYKIPGVCQFNIPIDVTLSRAEVVRKFTAVLRDVMRQDPDVLMVSEVRDNETANLAIEFTTTGHRCFTTAHAEGGIDGLARLTGKELAIESDTLAGDHVINCVLYQKLLPKLCPECKKPANHPTLGIPEAKRKVLVSKYQLDPGTMYVANPSGCPACKPTVAGLEANGTKGVSVACEVFIPTLEMLPLIASRKWAELSLMWRQQRVAGFASENMLGKTAYEHGLLELAKGNVALEHLEEKFEPIESYRLVDITKTKA